MNTHLSLSHLRNFKASVPAMFLLAFFLVCGGIGVVPSTAQSQPEARELDDKIPKHLPIKVKVKNLDKQNWVREVEVEVKNTGDKPIYYLSFKLRMPEVTDENGTVVAVNLTYGRVDLVDFESRPTAEDVPIQPGDTYIMKVPENQMRGWEGERDARKWSEPKKFQIKFRHLHHGDGTGFTTSGGLPIPKPNATSSFSCGRGRPTARAQRATSRDELSPPRIPSFQFAPTSLPVSFLPAKLFAERNVDPISNSALPTVDPCCPGPYGCSSLMLVPRGHTCVTCGPADWVQSAPCGTSYCGTIEDDIRYCTDDDGNRVGCHDYSIDPCPPPPPGGEESCDPFCAGGGRNAQPDQPRFVNAAFAPNAIFNEDPCCITTPIVIDLRGDGFALTSAADGVPFDFNGDGVRGRISWTAAGSDEAWLVLDRNGNGSVDSGTELFGNATPQVVSGRRNGFLALAEYDKTTGGGNGDNVVSSADAIYSSLRLWQDANHDGVSQPVELHPLPAHGITAIELGYKESRRRDRFGNEFRYRGKVYATDGTRPGRWAYDVLLVSAQ